MVDRHTMKYKLDAQNRAVPVEDLLEWGKWFEENDRVVAQDYAGVFKISTVFLGLDHGWDGPPVLWETMIFNDPIEREHQQRYTSWEDAVDGHWDAVKWCTNETKWMEWLPPLVYKLRRKFM